MLTLSFLGSFQAKLGEDPIHEFESIKVRALLAYLMLESERPHSRDHLASLFWGNNDEAKSAKNMRQALSNLRKSIQDTNPQTPYLIISPDSVQANRKNSNVWLDTQAFEELISACEKHLHRDIKTCTTCNHHMEKAMELYRGTFLEGFVIKDSEYFQGWHTSRREYFHQKALTTLEHLVEYHQQRREYQKAIVYARRLVSMDEWREESHVLLMRLLSRDSQRSAAIKQYQKCRSILEKEFGAPPQPETEQLYQQILTNSASGAEQGVPPNNLPVFGTTFVGRQKEIQQTIEYLQTKNRRLVTIVGPGGVGKTRLALQVGQDQLLSFQDGVYWIPLDTIEAPAAIPDSIAGTLGLELPAKGDPQTHLLNFLRHREILLIFDNYEHVLPETGLIKSLLTHAPGLSILITSREALHLQMEWEIELSGLPLSEEKDGEGSAAVQLLQQRAERIDPAFSISAGQKYQEALLLCEILDGLPLGIELAANLIKNFSCAQIAEQISQDIGVLTSSLRDVPPRHRSLWVVFEHSWNFLTEEEKRAFAALGTFPARFTPDAASEICAVSSSLLAELCRKSLVRQFSRGVFGLHPLLRQYARRKQNSADISEAEMNERFKLYFANHVQAWERNMKSENVQQALDGMSQDWLNLAVCWNTALDIRDFETLNTLLSPFFWFFEIKGKIYEGDILFKSGLDEIRGIHKQGKQGRLFYYRLLAYYGWLSFRRGQTDTALKSLGEAVEHGLKDLGIAEKIFATNHLGGIYYETGNKTDAHEMHREAMRLCEKGQALWEEALTCNHYGSMLSMEGDLDGAAQILQRGSDIAETHGYTWITASILSNLAVLAYFRQDYRTAIDLFLKSNEKSAQYGDIHRSPSVNHNNLAECYAMLGQLEKASEHLNSALYHFNECGNVVFLPYVYNTLAIIHLQSNKYPEARKALDDGIRNAVEYQMHNVLNNLLIDYAKYFLLTGNLKQATRIVRYVIQSPDTIKEGRDKADSLFEEFGDDLRREAGLLAGSALTRQEILDGIKT
ncbi:MAG: tetratricopeptide repeat protein [Anaerolineae bacterium]|nr:tetratricopeptide repeat protein [Anaerolineae bacterium]